MTIAISPGPPAVGGAAETPETPEPDPPDAARGGAAGPFSARVLGRVTRGDGRELRGVSGLDLSDPAGDGAVFAR
jgi:hypothetical protein